MEIINPSDEELIQDNKYFIKHFVNGMTHILILYILSNEKIHGYGITKKMNEFLEVVHACDKTKRVNPSKIYPILSKMEAKGIVQSEEGLHNNKKIKYYEVTPKGHRLLKLIQRKWHKLFTYNDWKSFFEDMTGTTIVVIGDE